MVNMGRIHRELGKLVKMIYYERELQEDSMESKIIEFDFDFAEKLKIEVR